MTLEIIEKGEIVLREVTDEAWAYITEERHRYVCSDFQHWIFSRDRYEGTVYVTATPDEDKTQLVRITDKLIAEHGLTVTKAAMHLLRAWRRDYAYSAEAEKSNVRENALRAEADFLRHILANGCLHCGHFAIEQIGDDTDGYCLAVGVPQKLDSSPLRFEYGEYDENMKVHHFGRKYYPCDGCKYLKGERA